MRLLLLGNPSPASWKWDVADEAAALGWHVTHMPARGVDTRQVQQAARGADLLLWARTHHHDPAGDIAGMLRRIEDAGTATAALHLDLYWTVPHRQQHIGRHPWWSCQTVWTADGGNRDWAGRGVTHRWCPPAVGRRWLATCPPGTPRRRWPYEVVFVGTYNRRVHQLHRGQLLAWAHRTFGPRFAHLGATATSRITGHQLCGLYRQARLVLGDSAPAGRYWSDRVPHTLARGGLLAHPHTTGMHPWGLDERVLIDYPRGRWQHILHRLQELTPATRAQMTEAGWQVVAGRHLWRHRLQHIAEQAVPGW